MNLINFIKFGTEIKPLMSTLNPSKIELIKSMLIELYLRLLLAHLNLKEKKGYPQLSHIWKRISIHHSY